MVNTTVVIDAADQQSIRARSCGCMAVALIIELGLHRVKEIAVEDGGLLAGEDLALEGDLADVEPIAQKMGERASRERDPSNRSPGVASENSIRRSDGGNRIRT